MWSVTGKIIVLAVYKSTLLCKTVDLGMVLDSGQGKSQGLDQVADSGISGQAVSEKITLLSVSVTPSLALFLVFYFCLCFALFFSFQHIESKIEDFCAAVGCLAIL